MKFVTRAEAVAKVQEKKVFEVEIEELGGFVKFRGMTGAEQLEFEKAQADAKKADTYFDMTLEVLSKCILDENGDPLFPGEQGVKDLGSLPQRVIRKLEAAVVRADDVPKLEEYILNLRKIVGGESISESVKASE